MSDDRNSAERAFDAMVNEAIWRQYVWDANDFVTSFSPDGLVEGAGQWRLLHQCPAPDAHVVIDTNGQATDHIRCSGCGQMVTAKAWKGWLTG